MQAANPLPNPICPLSGRKALSVWIQLVCESAQAPGSASPISPSPSLFKPPICKAPAFRAPYLRAWYLHPEPAWRTPVSWTMDTVWIRWQRSPISHLHILQEPLHCIRTAWHGIMYSKVSCKSHCTALYPPYVLHGMACIIV